MTKQEQRNRVLGLGARDRPSVNLIALMIAIVLCLILFRII